MFVPRPHERGQCKIVGSKEWKGEKMAMIKLTTFRYNLEADLKMTDKEYDTGCMNISPNASLEPAC